MSAAASQPDRCRPETARLALALGLALGALAVIAAWPAGGTALAPLELLTAQLTEAMLASAGLPVLRQGTVLVHPEGFTCSIGSACTALTPAVLLVAAILSQPVPGRARLAGAAAGTALVVGVNQLRLVGLVWVGVHQPGWFDAAHAFLGPALLALATVACGVVWHRAAHRQVP